MQVSVEREVWTAEGGGEQNIQHSHFVCYAPSYMSHSFNTYSFTELRVPEYLGTVLGTILEAGDGSADQTMSLSSWNPLPQRGRTHWTYSEEHLWCRTVLGTVGTTKRRQCTVWGSAVSYEVIGNTSLWRWRLSWASHVDISGKSVLTRGNSQCKGDESGLYLMSPQKRAKRPAERKQKGRSEKVWGDEARNVWGVTS